MKIAFILNEMKGGGIERLLLELGNYLKKKHDVYIITTEGKGKWYSKIHDNGINAKSFSIWDFPEPITFIKTISNYINIKNFDAIFLNNTLIGNASLPLLNSNIVKLSVLHAISNNMVDKTLVNKKYIDGFIAVSPKTLDMLSTKTSKNNYLVPNGIKLSNTKLTKLDIHEKCNQSELRLLYCGRISHVDKGILYLPEIIKLIKTKITNFKLIILGDGPDFSKLIQLTNEFKLNKYVEFYGMVSEEIVKIEMRKAHFLLFPSIKEGFGLSIIEAQNNGCIPVASYIDGVTNYLISDKINGILCEIGDTSDMANNIIDIFRDKKHMITLVEEATKNSLKYSIDNTAKEWVRIVEMHGKLKSLKKTNKITNTDIKLLITSFCFVANNTNNNVKKNKEKWLSNVVNLKSNLSKISFNERIVIYGALDMAYLVYIDGIKHGYEIVAFVDNFSDKAFIKKIPIVKEEWLQKNLYAFDIVIISIESEYGVKLKNLLENKYPFKKIILWYELHQ